MADGSVLTEGTLSEWPLPHLLHFIFRSGATGRLEIDAPAGQVVVCFAGGLLVGDGGSPAEAANALLGLFSDEQAAFRVIEDSSKAGDGPAPDAIDPRTLLLPGIRAAYNEARVDRELQPVAGRKIQLAPDAMSIVGSLGFGPSDGMVVDALRAAPTTVDDLLALGKRIDAKTAVLALFFAELIEVKTKAQELQSAGAAAGRVSFSGIPGIGGGAKLPKAPPPPPPNVGGAPPAAPLELKGEGDADSFFANPLPPPAVPAAASTAPPPPESGETKGGKAGQRGEVAFEKGRFLLRKNDWAGAEAAFREAAKVSPRAEFRAYEVWARFMNPDIDKEAEAKSAVVLLEELLKEDPRFVFGQYFIGLAWKQLGNRTKAQQAFEIVCKLDDTHLDAQRELRILTMRTRSMPAVTDAPAEAGEGVAPEKKKVDVSEILAGGLNSQQKILLSALGGLVIVGVYLVLGGGSTPPPPPPPAPRPPAPVETPKPSPPAAPGEGTRKASAVPEILQAPKAPTVKPGQLVLITNPAGAVAWVDGKERGKTPVVFDAGAGKHRVALIAEGKKLVREEVDSTNGAEVVKVLEDALRPAAGMVGIKVRCKTEGIMPVLVDGQDTGLLCPTERIDLQPGRHSVGLYDPRTDKIEAQEQDIHDTEGSERIRFRL